MRQIQSSIDIVNRHKFNAKSTDPLSDNTISSISISQLVEGIDQLHSWLLQEPELIETAQIQHKLWGYLCRIAAIDNYQTEGSVLAATRPIARIIKARPVLTTPLKVLVLFYCQVLKQVDIFE